MSAALRGWAPSPEQEAVRAAIARREGSVMIEAGAGCAKSSTLELSAPGVRVPALALAFNKSIAADLGKRLPPNFQAKTMNAIGHGAWGRARPGVPLDLQPRKLGTLVSALAKEWGTDLTTEQWTGVRELVEKVMQWGLVPADDPECPDGGMVGDEPEVWADAAQEVGLGEEPPALLLRLAQAVLRENIALARKGTISFDDQVYCSVLLGGRFPAFPVVMVDENQDLSPLNHRVLAACLAPGGRLITVGDKHQCHPPGTMIYVTGVGYKQIETLKEGDQLASYYTQKSVVKGMRNQGRKIEKIHTEYFSGKLIEIICGHSIHRVTPAHRCLVRLNQTHGFVVYMMRRDMQCRIGIAKVAYESGFGPVVRARSEGADAVWLLGMFDSKEEAWIAEQIVSVRFGVPQLVFRDPLNNPEKNRSIDTVWNEVGANWARGQQVLFAYNKLEEYPIWTREDDENQHYGFKSFMCRAANLIHGMEMVNTFELGGIGSDKTACWTPISLKEVEYTGPVYGLQVEPTEGGRRLYIANDIVTGNSIYGFRGASGQSAAQIRRLLPEAEWTDCGLMTTYRCPRAVVERQQEHAPGYRAADGAPEGLVEVFEPNEGPEGRPWGWERLSDAMQVVEGTKNLMYGHNAKHQASLAVLCRNNAPLMSLAFRLIRRRVGVVMLGRDIGKGLVALCKKIAPQAVPVDLFAGRLREWEARECALAEANGKPHHKAGIGDKADCLRAVLEGTEVRDSGALGKAVEALFARESGLVTLSSIHRAKGLDWDVVLHLDPWRCRAGERRALAQGDVQGAEQERNLRYVCETRTRHTLLMGSMEDFE